MSIYQVRAAGLGALGLAAAVAVALSVRRSSVLADAHFSALALGVVILVWSASGAYCWLRRRPNVRLGALLGAGALLATLAALTASSSPTLHALGRLAVALLVFYWVAVFLAYPSGRLQSVGERRLLAGFGGVSVLLWVAALVVVQRFAATGPLFACELCPRNPLAVTQPSRAAEDALNFSIDGVSAVAILTACAFVVRKTWTRSRLRRRTMLPFVVCFAVWGLSQSAFVLIREADVETGTSFLRPVVAAAALAIPASMALGQWLGQVFTAHRLLSFVGGLEGRIDPPAVEGFMRSALGDPALRLLLWDTAAGSFRDPRGRRVELADAPSGTILVDDPHGQRQAAVVYDADGGQARELVESLVRTSLLLLDNHRLAAGVAASRSRLATAAATERLRLERDLHDGAQQRLLALKFALTDLREHAGPELRAEIEIAEARASEAIEELRELGQGIYPPLLVEQGVPAAVAAVARRASVDVRVENCGFDRSTPPVEHALYMCAREAIQNATKHGGRDVRVVVRLSATPGSLRMLIADDGAGFDPAVDPPRTGLVSMQDRIGSVGGRLRIRSALGKGTTISLVVPRSRTSGGGDERTA
jgi:signal transduction histidine kinase